MAEGGGRVAVFPIRRVNLRASFLLSSSLVLARLSAVPRRQKGKDKN